MTETVTETRKADHETINGFWVNVGENTDDKGRCRHFLRGTLGNATKIIMMNIMGGLGTMPKFYPKFRIGSVEKTVVTIH